MSYDEIITTLNDGYNVFWINSAYKVFLDNGKLYEINVYNGSMCGLQPTQYNDCFIQEALQC